MSPEQLDTEMEDDRRINPGQLDVECVDQSELFYKWSVRDAVASGEVEQLEFDLEVLESRLQLRARENPLDFGIDKVTEAGIKSAVMCSDKYIKAKQGVIAAKVQAAKLKKAVAAMDMKKRMLEALVTLNGQQYFAGPEVPHNLVKIWEAHREKRTNSVNEKTAAKARKRTKLPED